MTGVQTCALPISLKESSGLHRVHVQEVRHEIGGHCDEGQDDEEPLNSVQEIFYEGRSLIEGVEKVCHYFSTD